MYRARHTKRGLRVIYAVDRFGNQVKELVLRPDTTWESAGEYLWAYLDRVDPGLRLVHDVPVPRPVRPMFDPYADDQQYRRQLVRSGASKIRFFRD